MGQNHKGAILVLTDRATLHTRLKKLNNKESVTVTKGIITCLRKKNYTTHTLTFDNDMAFSRHKTIEAATGASILFCQTLHHPGQGNRRKQNRCVEKVFPQKNRYYPGNAQANTASRKQIE